MEFTPELIIDIKRFLKPDSTTFRMLHKGHEITFTAGDMLETIASQQAKIKQLRAALHEAKQCLNPNTTDYEYIEALERGDQPPEPPQESLTPAELGEMAGRAEAVEEPLKIRILRYLEEQTLVRPSIYALQRLFGNDIKETMIELRNDGVVWEYPSKHNTYREYVLTPQGMDYLATLDAMNKPTIETTEDYLARLD